jgi:membrane-bound serine protease (ClpP class)
MESANVLSPSTESMNRIFRIVCCLALMPLVLAGVATAQVFKQNANNAPRPAAIIPLHEDINFLSGALLERKFQQAIDDGAEVIIFDINSPGGLTGVTFELMDMVLEAKDIETVALIEKDAISGASLLALACDKILIRPDARIGDSGEIVMGEDGAWRYTEAKSRSVLAQKIRDTAAATGRPLALAEKLVDKDLVVFSATHRKTGEKRFISDREWESMEDVDQWDQGKPVREAGKEMFFTVNGTRAVELGMADHLINDRDEIAKILNVRSPIPELKRTSMDTVIWFLNTRFVCFLLIVIGLAALGLELSGPGMGIGGLVAVLCFSLFFWSRFLGGTSGWLEVILFLLGLVFIGCELFVMPGFGIPGLLGILLTMGSLVMASQRVTLGEMNSEAWSNVGTNVLTVMGAFVGFLVLLLVMSQTIGSIPGLGRLTLTPPPLEPLTADSLASGGSAAAALNRQPLWQRVNIGDRGTTDSSLRPSGRIRINNEVADATTEGDFVESGTDVTIIDVRGTLIVVRRTSEMRVG